MINRFIQFTSLLLVLLVPHVHAQNDLTWEELPNLPDPLGVAGPFVGTHSEAILVAGGANFPQPVWKNEKFWRDSIYVLQKTAGGWKWYDGGKLPKALAYGSAVSTQHGVLCMGGNDSQKVYDDVFLIRWNTKTQKTELEFLPSLPSPCVYGSATIIGEKVYFLGGQSQQDLNSTTKNFWTLDLSRYGENQQLKWSVLDEFPGSSRAFHLTIAQHNGFHDCLYVISGRRQAGSKSTDVEFLTDVWEYSPTRTSWRKRTAIPKCVMAGTAVRAGQSHIHVLGGASGEHFFRANELKDEHPGFPKQTWRYHTITDTWTPAGPSPLNHVTTTAVETKHGTIVASGEVRPRVRTPKVWRIQPAKTETSFGILNYIVLIGYLGGMVFVGFYFARRNKSINDYFRGGQTIPWWAAGCSIFATMLSSLTYTGIPSKAFAQDWVYSIGNFTIPLVAILAAYFVLPFFRKIDATSAYEYLERRFNRTVRLFGSASFIFFHLFRMAVVMSLTALALAIATPLTPAQAVLLMGFLSITYSTMGGIEAVIWTDTIQTIVLLGGALVALCLLAFGVPGDSNSFFATASTANKFNLVNMHWSFTDTQIAFWVIILGALGQNISSYTADQAVVQRYTTTNNSREAIKSIWTNALMTIPATVLFFSLGTALFVYYHAHPEKLDPNITTDQIFPLFISREMPIGLAGLMVAGIFAAAQSTVSTSMNSTATTLIVDFLKPAQLLKDEKSCLQAAKIGTVVFGVAGTLLGLLFVDPNIKSLFDAFIKVIGLFMGVLGGLFLLGAGSIRANSLGAMTGAATGSLTMIALWLFTSVNGYLYTSCGIAVCVSVGYIVSFLLPNSKKCITGLTIYTLNRELPNA